MLKQIVSIRLLQFVLYAALGLVVLAIAVAILRPPEVAVAAPQIEPNAPQATFVCQPYRAAVFFNRVHMWCVNPYNTTYYYWAVPNTDSATASRYLSLFTTAVVTGKNVMMYFDPAANGNSWGCGSSDCKPIWGAELIGQ